MKFKAKAIVLFQIGLLLSISISAQNTISTQRFTGLEYRSVGPTRGGRVTAVAGHQATPGTFFMGASGGGLWKTTDYGNAWKNVSDGFFASPSIGAIGIAPSKPEVLYVGTGSDGLRSNVISGKGVYKSSNAGRTWENVGLEKTGHIGAVEVHPSDPDIAFVAAIGNAFQPNSDRGVFRTRDGGKNWEKVLFLSDTVGFADLEFQPGNPQVLYAAAWRAERRPWTIISGGVQGGIYKSEDGGNTWRKLATGLPNDLIGKIDLAVSAADPKRVYALIEALPGGGLYRSNDGGESWSLVSSNRALLDRPFYYCNVTANPLNADNVFVNATGFWRSNNAGRTWASLDTPHGDEHDLWINPADTLVWIESNDGGANITRDGGRNWSTQLNQPTAELYQVEIDDQFPYWMYAGQQDNGTTIAVPSFPPYDSPIGPMGFYLPTGGCETGPAVPKPGNHNIVYANCKGCFSVYDKRSGQERNYFVGATNIYGHKPNDLKFRFQRVSPVHVSPHNPKVVYFGSQYLHRTLDEGQTWETISPDLTANEPDKQVISGSPITRDVTGEEYYSTIYEIRESSKQAGQIWVGANDGPIQVTRNNGKTWQNVTPAGLPKGGRVDCIEPSPHRANKAYAAILRYQLGDWHPYLYKTEDFGQSWSLITTGIPADYPVRTVREDPGREGLLFAGTEYGMFVSFDDGQNWQPFQRNLPITPVTDIKVHQGDLVLATMGRGFWILDNVEALRQVSATALAQPSLLLKPRDQYRLRYPSNAKGNEPYYPAPGVQIDYWLKDAPKGEVTLEILNAQMQTIRAFTTQNTPRDTLRIPSRAGMAMGFIIAGFTDALRKTPGLHRFVWDLRHLGAWDRGGNRVSRGARMAAPGQYYARLSVDGVVTVQGFKVLADPRMLNAGVTVKDMQQQEVLALQIIELESRSRILGSTITQERNSAQQKNDANLQAFYNGLYAELYMAEGRYMTPRLLDQITYLRSMLDQGDQKPGKDAFVRYDELKNWYNRLVKQSVEKIGNRKEFAPID